MSDEQILALFRARFGEHHFALPQRTLAWARDIVAAAREEVSGDAARYRWLRRRDNQRAVDIITSVFEPELLDAAIDAAIKGDS